jgi:hypothetical protein
MLVNPNLVRLLEMARTERELLDNQMQPIVGDLLVWQHQARATYLLVEMLGTIALSALTIYELEQAK